MRKLTLFPLLLSFFYCPDTLSQHKKAPPTKFDPVTVIETSKELVAAGIRSLRQVKLNSEGGILDTSKEYLFRFDDRGRLLELREYEYAKKWIKQKPNPPFDQFDYRIKKATQTNYKYDTAGNVTSVKNYHVLLAGSSDAMLAAFRKSGRGDQKFWSAEPVERQVLMRPFIDSFQRTNPGDEFLLEGENIYTYDADGNILAHEYLTDQEGKSYTSNYTYKYAPNGAVTVKRSITRSVVGDVPKFRGREIHYTYTGNSKLDSTYLFSVNSAKDTMNIAQKKYSGFQQHIHYNKTGLADTVLDIFVSRSWKYILSYQGSVRTAETLLSFSPTESRIDTASFDTYKYKGNNLLEKTTWHFASNKRTPHVTRVTTDYNTRNLPIEQTTEEINMYSGIEYRVEQVLSFYGNAADDRETALRRTRTDRLLEDYKEERAKKKQEEVELRAAQLKALSVPQTSGGNAKPVVKNSDSVLKFAEQMPAFDGDMQAFLSANLKYPEEAKSNEQEGRVTVQFVVQKDGSLVDITVKKSSGVELLDKEAMRVIGQMPKWIPGKQQGKAVNVYYTLPINFKLG